jgi:hypothetical protein
VALKAHPALARLAKAGVKGPEEVVPLVGFVEAAGSKEIVLRSDLASLDSVKVARADVIYEEQSDESSPALLLVRCDAPITLVTSAEGLQTLSRQKQPGGRTPADVKACIQRARDACIENGMANHGLPRAEAERVCDAGILPALREFSCRNRGGLFGGSIII